MPWQADLIAKCRSSIGEVKHRMETRSGAIGQPISAMDRAAAGQPISAMEAEAGMSGSQRIRKMRAKNKATTGPTGGSAYRRYMRKKKPSRAPVEIKAQWMTRMDLLNHPQNGDILKAVQAAGCGQAQGVVFGRMSGQVKPSVLFTTYCYPGGPEEPSPPEKPTDIVDVQPSGKTKQGYPAVDVRLRNGKSYRVLWWSKAFG